MSKKTDTLEAVGRVAQSLLEKLFSGQASMRMEVDRADDGSERLNVLWAAGGWGGHLTLSRPGVRELSAKELGGVLSYLETSASDAGKGRGDE